MKVLQAVVTKTGSKWEGDALVIGLCKVVKQYDLILHTVHSLRMHNNIEVCGEGALIRIVPEK